MKSLLIIFTPYLTTFVILFCLGGYFAGVSASAGTAPVGSGPYTPFAKPPHPGEHNLRYRVTLGPDTNVEPADWPVTIHMAGPRTVSVVPMKPLMRLRAPEVPSKLRHYRFQPFPGYNSVDPLAINHQNQIVGYCSGGGSGAWLVILAGAFLWQGGRMHTLETLPDYRITHAVALNERDTIAGDATIDSFPADMDIPGHAICWVRRKVRDLGTGEATGVNNAGDIVGDSGIGPADYSHPAHAVLWTHGFRYDLNDCIPPHSGWVLTSASGINDKGQIVGHGLFHGEERSFLLTPKTH